MLEIFDAGHVPQKVCLSNSEIAQFGASAAVDTTKLSWDFCSNYKLDIEPALPDPMPYVALVGDIAPQPTMMGGTYLTISFRSSSIHAFIVRSRAGLRTRFEANILLLQHMASNNFYFAKI